jgi:hypothetical protein
MTNYEIQKLCGLVINPAEVERVVASLPNPQFVSCASHLAGTGEGKDIWFWAAEEAILGKVLASYHQKIGDCVSHGWARGCQDLMLIEIANGDMEEVPKAILDRLVSEDGEHGIVATEPIYGGSRCEVGGWWGRNDDGSIGAWGAKWVSQWGVILRDRHEIGSDVYDLTHYDSSRAKSWGARGCPDPLEGVAKMHPVQTVTQCSTYEEVRDMLANGYPVPVASMQGFAMKRSVGGWCRPSGTWAHQMTFRGSLVVKGNRPAVVCQNSWGDYLGSENNRVQLESGKELTLPSGAFLVEPEIVTRMARGGDTFAASSFKGFPRRNEPIPWIFASATEEPKTARKKGKEQSHA